MKTSTCAWVLLFAAGCGPSFKDLQTTPFPQVAEVKTKFRLQDSNFYSTDATFKAKPESWLGRVAVVRKSAAGTCDENGTLDWEATYVRGAGATPNDPLGYPLDPKVTDPELREKSIVTHNIAINVAALSYLAAQVQANMVAEVILTDFVTQRIAQGAMFEQALSDYKTAHQSDLITNPDVCYVIVVSGVVHKTLTKKFLTKIDGKANIQYSGMNVGGDFYSSDDSYSLDHLFELSPVVLKRMPVAGPAVPQRSEERKASPADLNLLRSVMEKFETERIMRTK